MKASRLNSSEIVLVLHCFNLQSSVTYEVSHNLILIVTDLFSKFLLVYCVICDCQMQRNLVVHLGFKFTPQKIYINDMKFFITRRYKFQNCWYW